MKWDERSHCHLLGLSWGLNTNVSIKRVAWSLFLAHGKCSVIFIIFLVEILRANKLAKDNSSLALESKISSVWTSRVNSSLEYQPLEYLEFQASVARGFPNWNIAPKKAGFDLYSRTVLELCLFLWFLLLNPALRWRLARRGSSHCGSVSRRGDAIARCRKCVLSARQPDQVSASLSGRGSFFSALPPNLVPSSSASCLTPSSIWTRTLVPGTARPSALGNVQHVLGAH